MGNILIYDRTTSITGKAISKALGIVGKSIYSISDSDEIIIRWGCSRFSNRELPYCINKSRAIKIASDGLLSLQVLGNNGFFVPKVFLSLEEIPDNTVVLARKINHRAGQDIIVCHTKDEARRIAGIRDFFVEYIPTSKEIRVHVINNEPVKIFRKEKESGEEIQIRSSKNGWGFKRVLLDYYLQPAEIAVRAVSSIGLDFGAVDMAFSKEHEKWVIWEINTGPSLNSASLELYSSIIKKMLDERTSNV